MEEHIVTIELPADCSMIELDEKVMEKNDSPDVINGDPVTSLMGKIFFVDDDSSIENRDNVLMIAEQDEPINLEIKRKSDNSNSDPLPEVKVLKDNVSFEINVKDGLYLCPQCPKGFKQKNNTVAHFKMVHLKVLHQCKICGLEVKKIRQHMVDVHDPKTKETCTICGKQYDTGRLIKDHYQKTHKQRKDGTKLPRNLKTDGLVKCMVCQETISKARIDRHMHFRHYLPPSYCVVCPLCHVKVKFIPWHMQKCHKGSNYTRELYRCKRCDEWFNNKPDYIHHQENHVDYGCQDCGEHFEKHLDLAKHMFHSHQKVFNIGQKNRSSKKSIIPSDNMYSQSGFFKIYSKETILENPVLHEYEDHGENFLVEKVTRNSASKDTKNDGLVELDEKTHYVVTKKLIEENALTDLGGNPPESRNDITMKKDKLEQSKVVYSNSEMLVSDEMDPDCQFETFIVHVNADGRAEKIEDAIAEVVDLPSDGEQDLIDKDSDLVLSQRNVVVRDNSLAGTNKEGNSAGIVVLGDTTEDTVMISQSDMTEENIGQDLIKILMQHEGNLGHFWIHKNDPLIQRMSNIDENLSMDQFEEGLKFDKKFPNKMCELVAVEAPSGSKLPRYLSGDDLKNIDILENKPDVEKITQKELERFQIGLPKQSDKKTKYQTCPSRQPHLCPYCMKIMKNKGALKRHIDVVHLKVKPFKCDDCDKGFATNADRMRHINLYHNQFEKNKLIECEFCSQSFKKAYIRRHILYKHKQCKLSTKCTTCDKDFKTREIMMRHVRLTHHSDKMLQTCKFCGLKQKNIKKHESKCKGGSNDDANEITVYSKEGKHLVVEKMLKLGGDTQDVIGELDFQSNYAKMEINSSIYKKIL